MKTNLISSLSAAIVLAGAVSMTSSLQVLAEPSAETAVPEASATGLSWGTDLPKALAQAKAGKKAVLLFFHGSDWCPPCVEMQKQVLDSPEFISYARRALVLVDVDFPQKSAQSDELKQANAALKAKFNLSPEPAEGFPSLVLLNDAGQTLFQETGYTGGGVADVLPKLQRHTGTGEATGSDKASAAFKNLSVEEFARMVDDKQNVILDVRTPGEYQAGHIPGAVNLNVGAADFQVKAAALDRSKTYLVHCASGVRSVRACNKLNQLDFPNLYNLPGGFNAWAKAGRAVEK